MRYEPARGRCIWEMRLPCFYELNAFFSILNDVIDKKIDLNQQGAMFPGANLFAQQITNAVSENQAYQAQYALDPSSMPPSTGGYVPNNMNSINAFYVGGINQPGTTTSVYPHVQNMVNTIMQLLRIF